MAEATARFTLPLIQVGQAQKEVTYNEAVRRIDMLLHLSVESRSLAQPPAAPAAGKVWIVPPDAADAWAGHTGELAEWDGAVWAFTPAQAGTLVWVADAAVVGVYTGRAWATDYLPVGGLKIGGAEMFGAAPVSIAAPMEGAVVDVEARAALSALLGYLRVQGVLAA